MTTDNGQTRSDVVEETKEVDPAVLKRTVIDVPGEPAEGIAPNTGLGLLLFAAQRAGEFEPWGRNVKLRDGQLRDFITTESQFTSALGVVCARNMGFKWEIEGAPETAKVVQEKLQASNMGKGWEDFISSISTNLYTSDTGAFIEIVRQGDTPDAPFIGLNQLDSSRCWHTGNPLKPVLYKDWKNKWHLLDWWNVIELTELPAGIEGLPGIQYCALTRLLLAAQVIRNIEIYQEEKAGGRHNRAIHFVSGILGTQIKDAMEKAAFYADAQGLQRYAQPIIVGAVDTDVPIDVKTLALAALPENFNAKETFDQYIAQIAMAFLTDYQEFAPLPGGNLGTSTQSEVLHMKSRGKGPGLFMNLIQRAMNFRVLPPNVRFVWREQDEEAEGAAAEASKKRAETRKIQVEIQEITPEESRQMAADSGDIPQEFLSTDETPTIRVGDEGLIEINKEVAARKQGGGRAGPFDDERKSDESRYERAVLDGLEAIEKNVNAFLVAEDQKSFGGKQIAVVPEDVQFWTAQEAEMFGALGSLPEDMVLTGIDQARRLGLTFDFELVNQQVLDFTSTYRNVWWDEVSTTTREGLRKAIQTNISTGEPLSVLVKDIETLFGKARAEAIASTEVTRLYAEGNALAYAEAGVATVEFQTVGDSLVDPDCEALDGETFPVGETGNRPPIHVRCRCWIAPVVDDKPLTKIVES